MADAQKFLDSAGLAVLWGNIKTKFVAKESGKGLSENDFTTALKTKLAGIEEGAQVNQNAFTTISDGTNNVVAAAATDTVTFKGAGDISVAADAAKKEITISATIPTYEDATTDKSGLMSAADKTKLDGIAAGAEVNQNAYSSVKVGEVTLTAASKTSAFEIAAGANVQVAGDAAQGKVTISATDTTYVDATSTDSGLMSAADKTKLDGIAAGADVSTIKTVKVNGTPLVPDGEKAVAITVPTNNNELTNGAGYQTAADVQTAITTAVASVYTVKGSVNTDSDLPTTDQKIGDVYNIVADSSYGPAGMNVVWTGTDWDALGSSLSVSALTTEEINAICV